MRKFIIFCCGLISAMASFAQQYPFFTQYRGNYFMLNPAVAGTRKIVDVRGTFRNQWLGMPGAPATKGLSGTVALWDGRMGLGAYLYNDMAGSVNLSSMALAYSYHIRFSDVQLSVGINASQNTIGFRPSTMTFVSANDEAIQKAMMTTYSRNWNAATGFLIFNEHFFVGMAVNNLFSRDMYFLNSSTKTAYLKMVPHMNMSIAYNWAENPDYVWENAVLANFVPGTPFLLDYYLRLHTKRVFFIGAGIRLKNALVGQIGFTLNDMLQVSYSYDYTTNRLKLYSKGSHEFSLVFSYGQIHGHKKNAKAKFLHKHYYFF